MNSKLSLRRLSPLLICCGLVAFTLHVSFAAESTPAKPKPTPAILDTDIGDDIDDTWALGLLLKSPELDLKLVLGDRGAALYRAKLLAKLLERAGRADVPVGVGLDIAPHEDGRQAAWVKDYERRRSPGRVGEGLRSQ
jgi:hypothetical protein